MNRILIRALGVIISFVPFGKDALAASTDQSQATLVRGPNEFVLLSRDVVTADDFTFDELGHATFVGTAERFQQLMQESINDGYWIMEAVNATNSTL